MSLQLLDDRGYHMTAPGDPFWYNSPVPFWGDNGFAAGASRVGVGHLSAEHPAVVAGVGCPCVGTGQADTPVDYQQTSWGVVALAAAGFLVVGLILGAGAARSAAMTPSTRRRNPGKVVKFRRTRRYRPPKGSRPGSGERFRAMTHHLERRGGVRDPKAVAAAIGRKKYGKRRFQEMAAAGRRRAARRRKAALYARAA